MTMMLKQNSDLVVVLDLMMMQMLTTSFDSAQQHTESTML